jgi:uncharacterized protein
MKQTAWGRLRVADAHIHFFSHRFFTLLAAQSPHLREETPAGLASRLGWTPPPEDAGALAASWIEEMDRHGVDRAALIASLPGDEESVLLAVRSRPDRLHGFFMVNPLAPDALERTEKALEEPAMKALCFFPAMHGYSMAGDSVTPLLEAASGRAATLPTALFVHCGVLTVGIRQKLGLPSRFDMRFSNPIDLHPVALRYPALPFIVPHFGAGYFREALMLGGLCPNVYLDTSSSNSWRRYLDPQPTLAGILKKTIDVLGPKRLLFGTDSSFFPRGWHSAVFEEQTAALQEIGASHETAAAILSENLASLLGVNRA